MRLPILSAFVAGVLLSMGVASAAVPLTSRVEGVVYKQAQAPVVLDRCAGYGYLGKGAMVWFHTKPGYGTVRKVEFQVDVRASDDRRISDFSHQFTLVGTFSPGVSIAPEAGLFGATPQFHHVTWNEDWTPYCGIVQVTFADGTVWKAPAGDLNRWSPLDDVRTSDH